MAQILTTMREEILLEIIEHVQDQISLHSFMQCSHATYDMTLPLLYKGLPVNCSSIEEIPSMVQP